MDGKSNIGVDLFHVENLESTYNYYITGLDTTFIAVPLVNPLFRRRLSDHTYSINGPLTRSDMVLVAKDWKRILGKITSSINVDSEIKSISENSESILRQELQLASHLCVGGVIIELKNYNCSNLSRILFSIIEKGISYHAFPFLIKVPITPKGPNPNRSDCKLEESPLTEKDPWEWWNKLRSLSNFHDRLFCALSLTENLPSDLEISRWMGEPVKAICISINLFIFNQHNYPVLSRQVQQIIRKFLMLDVSLILTGNPRGDHSFEEYLEYMKYLKGRGPIFQSNIVKYRGYEDVIEIPLQPLSDNLEADTYELFETDPIKYKYYQIAIEKALCDRVPEEERCTKEQVIMILGAGRGPLVQASIEAAKKCKLINCKFYAVEKNPMAVNTLHALNEQSWKSIVTVIETDMRHFKPSVKADILVSELLGSFGCNELSPECLDGAEHLLKPDGISIPCSYTSWLAPIHSPKLRQELKKDFTFSYKMKYKHEKLYVVQLINFYRIADAKECWSFHHPSWTSPSYVKPVLPNDEPKCSNNNRQALLRFRASQNCILTGFAGYFSTCLYKDIFLSTEPQSYSELMVSWFPAYFPLKNIVEIKQGDIIEVKICRLATSNKVWYEWLLNSPIFSHVHNINGRSYNMKINQE